VAPVPSCNVPFKIIFPLKVEVPEDVNSVVAKFVEVAFVIVAFVPKIFVNMPVSAVSMFEKYPLVEVELVIVAFPLLVRNPVFSTQFVPSQRRVELIIVPFERVVDVACI